MLFSFNFSYSENNFYQFISTYEFTEFSVSIYYNTFSFESSDHYTGTNVVNKVSRLRIRSPSTCSDVKF